MLKLFEVKFDNNSSYRCEAAARAAAKLVGTVAGFTAEDGSEYSE